MNTKRVNRTAHVIAAVLISPALCMPARAETLRCGNALIKTEHTADYVLGKCGPPSSKEKITRPVYATRPNGSTFQVGTYTIEIWRYERRPGQFPAVLTFEGGKLKKLEYERG